LTDCYSGGCLALYLAPRTGIAICTQQVTQLRGADSLQFIEQNDAEIRENRAKWIKLGLDLQGGMRVVLKERAEADQSQEWVLRSSGRS
jgi:preprotein translocase subunit SecD